MSFNFLYGKFTLSYLLNDLPLYKHGKISFTDSSPFKCESLKVYLAKVLPLYQFFINKKIAAFATISSFYYGQYLILPL